MFYIVKHLVIWPWEWFLELPRPPRPMKIKKKKYFSVLHFRHIFILIMLKLIYCVWEYQYRIIELFKNTAGWIQLKQRMWISVKVSIYLYIENLLHKNVLSGTSSWFHVPPLGGGGGKRANKKNRSDFYIVRKYPVKYLSSKDVVDSEIRFF